MLTKKTQKIAETIAQELAPNFKELAKLGATYEKARKEAYKASESASAWNWHRTEESQKTRTNCKEWGEKLKELYKLAHDAETLKKVTQFNYKMALADLCATLGELVRPYWRELAERQGLKSLCDYINQVNEPKGAGYSPKVARVSISYDCTFINEQGFTVRGFSLGACGLSASLSVYYKKNEQEQPHEIKARERLTVAKYWRRVAQLEKIEKEAEELNKKARELGGDLWRFGFVKTWNIRKD